MERRKFLKAIALGGGLAGLGSQVWAASSAATGADSKRKLIVIMLRGAVDGLNVVAPFSDPDYARLRPTIAIARPGQENGLLALDTQFGLHPALGALLPLWQEKKLAFVHAAGSPDPTRSHFDAQDYMESGTPGRKGTQDGWMNRLLTVLPGSTSPTRAMSIGPVMPRILSGSASAGNLASGPAGIRPTVLDQAQVGSAFDRLYQDNSAMSRAYREGKDAHKAVMAAAAGDDMQSAMTQQAADAGAPLPNGFPDDAARLAQLMRKDPEMQIVFMALGGWDTHANQGAAQGQLANRLNPLGLGLATLARRLGPIFDDTAIVVLSEFGRTASQNGNGGTDHGHGNAIWLLGGGVAGGKVHGEWRGLASAQLHEGRDLPVTTDFRSVLAQVAERHLRLSDPQLARLFPLMPERAASLNIWQG
ncbi:DUF1501 domain-containing protein [soil metagenome]